MAAGTIRGITIEIEGKTSGLVKSLGDVNKSLKDTQNSLKTVNEALKIDPKNVDTLKTKQNLLNQAIKETQEKLELEKKAAADAAEALEKGTITKNQYDTLQAEVAKTSSELKKLEGQAKETNQQLKDLGGTTKLDSLHKALDTAQTKLKSLGEGMSKVGTTLSKTVTVPLLALGTGAVKTAADFEQSMAQVAAVSGAAGDDLDALTEKAREMGANTKFSASEAAEAMNYMAMAGWKTEDMMGGIAGIMDLAAASGEDLATTSDIVTDALTAFGMSADESGRFADILAAASSNANTNVSMMGESFKYVAPLAGSMGYSAEDVSVALGLMANSGIKASSAGTALRTLLTNMAKPTDAMADAMDKLGISLDDGHGNMKSLRDIMKDLRSGFGDLKMSSEELEDGLEALNWQFENGMITEDQFTVACEDLIEEAYGAEGALKAETAAALAGKQGLSGLMAIVNASDEDFDKLTEAIDGSNGAASNMAGIMQDTLEGRIQQVKSKLEESAITIGEKLIPIVEKLVEWIGSVIDWFNGLDEGTQEVIITVGLLVAALGPVLTVGGKVVTLISSLVGGVSSIISAISGAGGLSAVLTTTCAGPLAAVALAIGAIIAVMNNWDEICEVVEFAWEKMCDFMKGLMEGVKNAWNSVVDTIESGFEAVLGDINAARDEALAAQAEINATYADAIAKNHAMADLKYGTDRSGRSSAAQEASKHYSDQYTSDYKKKQAAASANTYATIAMGNANVETVVINANSSNTKRSGGR